MQGRQNENSGREGAENGLQGWKVGLWWTAKHGNAAAEVAWHWACDKERSGAKLD